ncbi:MAG: kinase [Lentisphaerae bacterium]|nr:kinase [Lentisphaerota bacterium]
MIISRTPYRISFFGGGTDYPVWYEKHGGAVLAAAINRYCYIFCRHLPPFFKHRHSIIYSKIELVEKVDEIVHPAVREALRLMSITEGLDIHHDGDLPKQTGLGTSSSFAVGLLNALHALKGEMTTPEQLAQEATRVERDLCGDNVGSQDQVTAAHGGFNHVRFLPGGIVTVHPMIVPAERMELFQQHLVLLFTGFSRVASEIAAEQIQNTPKRETELHTIHDMVQEGVDILRDGSDLRQFGKLMHEGWKLKRTLSSRISNSEIDAIYDKALAAGALGGKLCGAGGGGFLLLFVEPDKRETVCQAMEDRLHVPFSFDWLGSRIVFYQPDARGKDADSAIGGNDPLVA